MKIVKIFLLLLAGFAFSTKADELWDKYFFHVDRAEKFFWDALCGAERDEEVGNMDLFRQVDNDLHTAREIAIKIEKDLPPKLKQKNNGELEKATQNLRFLFESLQRHPITKLRIIIMQKTNFLMFGQLPARQQNYRGSYKRRKRVTLDTVNLEEYRDWLGAIVRYYKSNPPLPPRPYTGGQSKSRARREYSKYRKNYEKCIKAINEYLEIIMRLRMASAELYQRRYDSR